MASHGALLLTRRTSDHESRNQRHGHRWPDTRVLASTVGARSGALREGAGVSIRGYLIDFWGLGYEIAERMGIMPTLRKHSYQMKRLLMVDRDGREEAHLDLTPLYQAQRGRFISVARADLASALAAACEGIPIHFNVSISAIAKEGADSLVTLSDGRQERFDLVVGADGLHASVIGDGDSFLLAMSRISSARSISTSGGSAVCRMMRRSVTLRRTPRHAARSEDCTMIGGGALSGIVFVGGLALLAAQFLVWLF